MKFIHTADLHIGAVPEEGSTLAEKREQEIKDLPKRIIDLCIEQKADMLLISGDLFHKSPTKSELMDLNTEFARFNGVVAIVAGNHDSLSVGSTYDEFNAWNNNVIFFKSSTLQVQHVDGIDVNVYGLSYRQRDITDRRLDGIRPKNLESINILLAHGGMETKLPMDFEALHNAGFDYLALGHIHKHKLISDYGAYPGSPEPLDLTETQEHGVYIGEIDNNKQLSMTFMPIALRKYIYIDIEVKPELSMVGITNLAAEKIRENGPDNMYVVKLSGLHDPEIVISKESLKRAGNIVKIIDETKPDYDYEQLMNENKNSIVGLFIQNVASKGYSPEIERLTLEHGIGALYHGNKKNNSR